MDPIMHLLAPKVKVHHVLDEYTIRVFRVIRELESLILT